MKLYNSPSFSLLSSNIDPLTIQKPNLIQGFQGARDELPSCGEDTEALRKCFLAGYFSHAARLGSDGYYHTVRSASDERRPATSD